MLDLLIRGAHVVDGTGGSTYVKNIGIINGRITMDVDNNVKAKEIVDATSLTLCPGFIDSHFHGDLRLEQSTLHSARSLKA